MSQDCPPSPPLPLSLSLSLPPITLGHLSLSRGVNFYQICETHTHAHTHTRRHVYWPELQQMAYSMMRSIYACPKPERGKSGLRGGVEREGRGEGVYQS